MDWLNYHHLLYFHLVVKQGGLSGAAEKLFLTQPTLSKQLKQLETALGVSLLKKKGRKLVPTEEGKIANQYAEDIFRLGNELLDTLNHKKHLNPSTLKIGTLEQLPKAIGHQLISPVLKKFPDIKIIVQEGTGEQLLSLLTQGSLDLVITDEIPHLLPNIQVVPLGESNVSAFASKKLIKQKLKKFPQDLMNYPWIIPWTGCSLRRELDYWLLKNKITVKVCIEAQDGGVQKYMGQEGLGVFVAPSAVAKEITTQFNVKEIGILKGVKERLFALVPSLKILNPALPVILEEADMFWKH